MKRQFLIIFYLLLTVIANAQVNDTVQVKDELATLDTNTIKINPGPSYQSNYKKPKPFSFLTHVPSDLVQIPKISFTKSNVKWIAIMAASTAALILSDEAIYKGVRKLSGNIHLHPEEKNKIIWSIKHGNKETVLLKAPGNLNTAFYNIGQGFTTMLLAAGFYVQGKISKNDHSLQTASDLTESFITSGLVTQLMKYISGRQTPAHATSRGGAWHPFPSISAFQNNKQNYDAFPSGHLTTLMAAVTIISDNYPNNKLVKPIGYTIVALAGFAMINNGVHWAGDYPLAIGLGWLTGKIITGRHKAVKKIKPTGL